MKTILHFRPKKSGIGGFDAAGALLTAYISFKEGRMAFMKARGRNCCGEYKS